MGSFVDQGQPHPEPTGQRERQCESDVQSLEDEGIMLIDWVFN